MGQQMWSCQLKTITKYWLAVKTDKTPWAKSSMKLHIIIWTMQMGWDLWSKHRTHNQKYDKNKTITWYCLWDSGYSWGNYQEQLYWNLLDHITTFFLRCSFQSQPQYLISTLFSLLLPIKYWFQVSFYFTKFLRELSTLRYLRF